MLVVKLYGIGNMLLFIPALRALQEMYPRARISILSDGRNNTDLLEGSGLYEKIFLYRREAGISPDLIRDLKRENFSCALFSFPLNEQGIACNVSLAGIPFLIGPADSPAKDFFTHPVETGPWPHEVEKNIHLLEPLGRIKAFRDAQIHLSREELNAAAERLEKMKCGEIIVGFHPGSFPDMAAKRWPAENYAALADRLVRETGATILFFGSREEQPLSEDIARRMASPSHILTGKLSLLHSAAMIRGCTLFISNDSGLMHVAAAVSTPVIGIFGPTDPLKNAPRGPGIRIVVQADLPCVPCYHFSRIACDDFECMRAVTVDRVFHEAEKLLTRRWHRVTAEK